MHGPSRRTRLKVVPPRPSAEVALSTTVQTVTDIRPFHVDMGGHFAAWEEPELFSSELRAAFSSLRRSAP
jgi:hypothetical protein